MKRCRKCQAVKPLEDFHRLNRVKGGRRATCKACIKEWREANKEKVSEYGQAWREANREELLERRRAAYWADVEESRRRQRASWWKHREKRLAETRAYHAKHSEERVQYVYAWNAANPEKAKARWTRQNLRRRTGKGEADLEYGFVLRSDPCSYCGETAGIIDHIDAAALGGPNTWDNLTAACNLCNSRKHTKPLLEFLHGNSAA